MRTPWLTRIAFFLALAAAEEDWAFDVRAMLVSATTAPQQACTVPETAASAWSAAFEAAVKSMLQKTRRTMQQGLRGVAQSALDLAEASTCGDLAAFKAQALRLRVLATSRGGLADLDSKVKYEPLQALSVGGVDVHAALNALIVAWQLQKGPEELGQALARFLSQFAAETEDAPAPPPPPPTTSSERSSERGSAFWANALSQAFRRLGDPSAEVPVDCLNAEAASAYSAELSSTFERMMEKSKRGMQLGMRRLAEQTLRFLASLCDRAGALPGARRLQSAAARLEVLASARTLVQQGVHVEYEALKALRVGGVDVHLELNRLIGSWLQRPEELGDALADFFEDFREEQEPEEAPVNVTDPLATMLSDAFLAADVARNEPLQLKASCLSTARTGVFAQELDAAIDHMLKKRKRTMQQGLKELADATDKLLSGEPYECVANAGAQAIWTAARKLRRLTRKTVVDYGANIQYEAMKSLSVGKVAVHAELNHFLAAWKLRSQAEAGAPFGELMLKLSAIRANDEL